MAGDRDNYNKLSSPFSKLILNNLSLQVMFTIGAIVIYFLAATVSTQRTGAYIVTCIFVPLYCYAVYSNNWGTALRDKNLVKYGHIQENRRRGFQSGLICAIPIFVYTCFAVSFAVNLGVDSVQFATYKIFTAPYTLFTDLVSERAPALMLLYSVFSPAFAALGYHNGYKEYRIWDHILYENGIKPKKGEKSNLPKARKPKT